MVELTLNDDGPRADGRPTSAKQGLSRVGHLSRSARRRNGSGWLALG
jgi:hypothetical protein